MSTCSGIKTKECFDVLSNACAFRCNFIGYYRLSLAFRLQLEYNVCIVWKLTEKMRLVVLVTVE